MAASSIKRAGWSWLGVLGVILVLCAVFACVVGPVDIEVREVVAIFLHKLGLNWSEATPSPMEEAVVWNLRMPRVCLAILAGLALSQAGAALQGLFRNPLADPSLIGVSTGGALGAVFAIVLGGLFVSPTSYWYSLFLPICAMVGSTGITFLIYHISRIGGRTHVTTMLLAGIAINALGAAVIGFIVTRFASDDQLRNFTFWSLGSFSGADWRTSGLVALIVLPGAFLMLRESRALNAFLLGEAEAFQLGIDVQRTKRRIIVLSALMVGATVAACGTIGFVGLMVPHLIRLAFGPDHRFLIPAAALLGGILLLLADMAARTLVAPAELQIGILTALVGGPFFLGLLLANRNKLAL